MHWPHPFLIRQGKRHHTLNIGCLMPVPSSHSALTQKSQKIQQLTTSANNEHS